MSPGPTPTVLSRRMLEADGWRVDVVEQTIRGAGVTFRRDLWGFADLLCLRGEDVLAVQVTSASNVSSRVKKIESDDLSEVVALVRAAGIGIVVHGWRRDTKGEWVCRTVDLS